MYSSSLTGLNIQYSRRSCQDDPEWVSSLDSSVRCSNLSPTDEKCHHIDTNGDTGYSSCPKACGNCFEDSLNTESESQYNTQPSALYSDETAEINDYDPYMSQNSDNMGDLQDLVYRFTYEINDKIDELSDRINNTGDDVEIIRSGEPSTGICRRIVCENISSDNLDGSDGQSIDNSCTDINPTCENSLFSSCKLPGSEREDCCNFKMDSGSNPVPIAPSYSDMDQEECEQNEDYVWDLVDKQTVLDDLKTYNDAMNEGRRRADSSNGGDPSNGEDPSNEGGNQDPYDTGIILYGSDDTEILKIDNTNQRDTTGIKTVDNVKYHKISQDIHSFSIPTSGIKPSNDKKISFCYFSDIEDSTDVKSKQWSEYDFLRNTTGNYKGYPRNGGEKSILAIKISDNYNSSMNEIFEDKTARYHIFISTSGTETDSYKLYYKQDKKYTVMPNPPEGLRLDNLYMKFNRNYVNNISESFSLTYTFTENTETKLDTTYNNIFSHSTNIQAIQPLFFKIFDKNDLNTDLDLDILNFELKMGTNSILTKDGNIHCKDVDNVLDRWWDALVSTLIFCIVAFSLALIHGYSNNENSSLFMTVFPILLGFIVVIISFIPIKEVHNKVFITLSTILYFIIVLCISITKFNNSNDINKIKTLIVSVLSFSLLLLTLGNGNVFRNKLKDPSDTNDCKVKGYLISPGIRIGIIVFSIIYFLCKIKFIDNDTADPRKYLRFFSISSWISGILYILFLGGSVFQYIYIMNKTNDMNETNSIYLGYDNKDNYSFLKNNTTMSIVRDILLII